MLQVLDPSSKLWQARSIIYYIAILRERVVFSDVVGGGDVMPKHVGDTIHN
jgi:hypothetical protein